MARMENRGSGCSFKEVREDFRGKMIFEQGLERDMEAGYVDIWAKCVLGRRNSKRKVSGKEV